MPTVARPGIVTLLAVVHFVAGGFWLLIALLAATAGSVATHDSGGPGLLTVAAILAPLGGIQILCGVGLWTLKPYGRVMQIVFACIGLLGMPFGTLIGVAILIYMFKPGVRVLFSGKAADALTPQELAEVATVSKYSTATAIAIGAVCVLGALVVVSIIAAIAIPGLLRARMNQHEAAAVQQLRAIAIAEMTSVASCGNGGYADSFAALAEPVSQMTAAASSGIATLATSSPGGYEYVLRAGAGATDGPLDCHGQRTRTAWYAAAVPVTFGTTGTHSFAVNSGVVIWQIQGGAAPTEPFGPPAVAVSK